VVVLGATAAVLAGALAVAALWIRHEVRGSLPRLDGEIAVESLSGPVTIERDALGVPTIRGPSRRDVAIATGFLHAQERFFQMDLLRRSAAGELAEIAGPELVGRDREARRHRFRAHARRDLEALAPVERRILADYAAGVAAGLAAMTAPPPEYLLLRVDPEPWAPEDSLLVVRAMYLRLQDGDGVREASFGVMHDVLPSALVRFLLPVGTEHDAPLDGSTTEPPPVPGPDDVDLRSIPPREPSAPPIVARLSALEATPGSNAWAVAGRHTAHGGAILANDMHLDLQLPNVWYRASLAWSEDGVERRVTGITLPGTPAVVAGTNGHVAWGLANAEGDFSDLVILQPAAGVDRYRTPEGVRSIEHAAETIEVRGADPVAADVAWTVWGPLVEPDHRGRRRALRWVAHDAGTADLDLLAMEVARDVDEALAIAPRVGVPTVSLVAADRSGRVGWTWMGPIPRRFGLRENVPTSWADGRRGWSGYLDPDEVPRVVDPPSGRVWAANQRALGGEAMDTIGDGVWALGARASRIRDELARFDRASESDMLALQLDDRAVFLSRWRELLLAALDDRAIEESDGRRALRDVVASGWTGRASVDSAAYRLVRELRDRVAERAIGALVAPCFDADPRFTLAALRRVEGPLWRLVTERPAHLLASRYASWDELVLEAADAVAGDDPAGLAARTWGERNTIVLRHPLSGAVPLVGPRLDLPPVELPGDIHMPRVQSPVFGASERMAVSPGREELGLFHMPGGQSGHPLSPHYGAGHDAWASGTEAPLLPGPVVHRLTLVP
jgi:penicillin amidase